MSTQAAPPEQDALAAQRAENREHYRRILRRFMDVGANIADALDPGPPDPALPPLRPDIEAAHAYHHVARAVRQAIMLADKLAEPLPPPTPANPPATARTPVLREVGGTAHQAARPERAESARAEALETERSERLEALERVEDLPDRPVEDLVLDIRRDLAAAAVPFLGPVNRRAPPGLDAIARFAPAPPVATPFSQPGGATRPAPFLHGKHDP